VTAVVHVLAIISRLMRSLCRGGESCDNRETGTVSTEHLLPQLKL